MDEINKKILRLLQKNSKITNAQLSKEVDLSPSSTLERVKKLESDGTIEKYSIKINFKKIDLNCLFFVFVKLSLPTKENVQNFTDKLENISEITEFYNITGSYDFLLKVIVKNLEDYNDFIWTKLSKIDNVHKIKEKLILNSYNNYNIKF